MHQVPAAAVPTSKPRKSRFAESVSAALKAHDPAYRQLSAAEPAATPDQAGPIEPARTHAQANEPAYRLLASAKSADKSDQAGPAGTERKHAPATGPPKPGWVAPPAKRHRGIVQPIEAAALPNALLTIKTVSALVGLAPATIYRRLAAGTFPAPIRLGARCTRFKADAIAAWAAGL